MSLTTRETDEPDQPTRGIPDRQSFRVYAEYIAIGLIGFPYNVMPPMYAAAALLLLSGMGIGLGIGKQVLNIGLMWIFFTVVAVHTLIAVMDGPQTKYLFSQTNHYWQFIVLFPGAVAVFRLANIQRLLARPRVQAVLWVSSAITVVYSLVLSGSIHEFSPNVLFLLVSLLFFSPPGILKVMAAVAIASLFLLSARASPVAVIAMLIAVWIVNPRQSLIIVAAAAIVVAPVIFYLTLDATTLLEIKQIDHNLYIRAEFIRAATESARGAMMTGVGFGPPYRPLNFNYLSQHILLTDPRSVNTVSNHHSMFDMAYRLGLPTAGLFFYAVFVRVRPSETNKMAKFFLLVLATGLSLNAWFENQSQLPLVALLMAAVFATQPQFDRPDPANDGRKLQ